MKLNEEFDDEVGDDEVIEVVDEPKGDMSRTVAGRTIWFRSALPGQFHAWRRYRESLKTRFDVVKIRAKKKPTEADLRLLMEISQKFDLSTLELVESLVVDPADVEFLQLGMISGKVTMADIASVLFADDDVPEDDVEVALKPRKPASVKKAVSNVKWTRK